VWGLLHGSYLAAYTVWRTWRRQGARAAANTPWPLFQFASIVLTFHLVTFAWIFFRAQSLSDAWYVVTHLFSGVPAYGQLLLRSFWQGVGVADLLQPVQAGMSMTRFVLMALSASALLLPAIFGRSIDLCKRPAWFRYSVYYLLLISISLLAVSGDTGFVYFQF